MRLNLGLPMLQTIAMILILWATWAPETHKFDLVLRDGTEIRGWSVLPGPDQDPMAWATGVNLPALPAEIAIGLASERFAHLPELNLQFFSLWFLGSLTLVHDRASRRGYFEVANKWSAIMGVV